LKNNLIKWLYISIFSVLLTSFSFSEVKKVGIAVLPFKVVNSNSQLDYLGKGIPDILITTLSHGEGVNIVERERINDIIKELELSQKDIFDDKNAVKVGKLTGSRYIITGTLTVIEDQVRIDSRIIDIETAKIIKGFSETVSHKKFIFDAIDKLSSQIASYLVGKSPNLISKTSPQLDVCFLIDSTGSMDDEIDVVKSKIRQIMSQVREGNPKPIVRYAIVDYKDEGDEYITRKLDFTQDINSLNDYLLSLQAVGGGDFEESLLEGLNLALNGLSWSAKSGKMIFLIADAPFHERKNLNIDSLTKTAIEKKISIFTIACSGIDDKGVNIFKHIASQTNGKFDFLVYKQQYIAQGRKKEVIIRGKDIYESDKALSRDEWGKGDFSSPKYHKRSGKTKSYSAETHLSDMEEDEREAKGAPIKKSGIMENNLDLLISKNIIKKGEEHGVSYQNNKTAKTVLIENEGVVLKVKINDYPTLKALQEANSKNESLWIAVSINANKDKLKAFSVQDGSLLIFSKKDVPNLSITTFLKISENPLYYEKHGILTPKRWFVNIRVKKITEN